MAARGSALALVLVPMVLAAGTAGAQVAADRETQRTQLYKEAVDLANDGRWAEAAEKLRLVLAIRSSPKVRFTLGQAEEHVGRLSSAYDDYAAALADAEVAAQTDVADTARVALRALGPRVPVLRVLVTGESADQAKVLVDERAILAGEPVRVDPGTHSIAVTAPGARAHEDRITISESQRLDAPVALTRVEPAPSSPVVAPADEGAPAEPAAGNGPWPLIGLVGAGVGVAGLGVGTYFGLDAISKNNTSNQTGCNGNACTTSAYAMREDARSAATISTVAFVVGGVLAAGGATLWLVSRHGDATVQLTPSAVVQGAGLTATGTF